MSKYPNFGHHEKRHKKKRGFFFLLIKHTFLLGLSISFIVISGFFIWVATLDMPDFSSFEKREISNSTKIYDRTGKIVLYDLYQNVRRSHVDFEKISPYIKNATIAIEDADFYTHNGFRPLSFLRAVYINASTGAYTQGGSTITQQVVKNAVLTREKSISRKLKEIVLAIKLDKTLSKDSILEIYLNENPYGGTIYGVQEASEAYFGKSALDVSITEAAYLAALPQSPTYYSPYGQRRGELEKRKNLVLERMYKHGFISKAERDFSISENITFKPLRGNDMVGLHFVFYVREYLEQKYGRDTILNDGLRVITTLDHDLQKKLETLVKEESFSSLLPNKASNAGLVALNPQTGEILAMVGSRDFFDTTIDGQFNITLANRQPGSSFKPIVYAAAFEKGYTPETVLFDVKTEFSTLCDPFGTPLDTNKRSENVCYSPNNYDNAFRGPISLRNSLAQSLNVTSVKLMYLTGMRTVITLANKMGLSTINDPSRYGLSLVLGGGEVSLVDLTSAYGVFANEGIYTKPVSILSVKSLHGDINDKNTLYQETVLSENTTSLISDILSDNIARTPAYGSASTLYFTNRDVAVKTGTTNDYRDLWVIGYTPTLALGMWAGNNDNSPVEKKVSGALLAPIWRKAMDIALSGKESGYFKEPIPNNSSKALLRGDYCNNGNPDTILAFIDKNDPENGTPPTDVRSDSQYALWSTPLRVYALEKGLCGLSTTTQFINQVIYQEQNSTTTSIEIPITTVP
jgi:penicillin-binding protein 1C